MASDKLQTAQRCSCMDMVPNPEQGNSHRVSEVKIFSKFDMKLGFWPIKMAEKYHNKTRFVVHKGHYEWNVMPFRLKNTPSESWTMP